MGEFRIFDRAEPDGYPETGTVYVGANGLAERVRWIYSILDNPTIGDGISGGNKTSINPYGIVQRYLAPGLHKSDDAVARLFVSLIYPGEGPANMDEYRRNAIDYLNTSDAGAASAFSGLTLGSTTYDDRVRRMVAALMTMPRFNEQ